MSQRSWPVIYWNNEKKLLVIYFIVASFVINK